MTLETLQAAKTECLRFMGRVSMLEKACEMMEDNNADTSNNKMYHNLSDHPAEPGAVRRASMDLTVLRRHSA